MMEARERDRERKEDQSSGGGDGNSSNLDAIPSSLHGYFSKQGHVRKNWKTRFFVLEMGRLSYFKKAAGSDQFPYGVDLLKSIVLRNIGMSHHDNPLMIYLQDTLNQYELFMKAESVDAAEIWRKALREHVAFAIGFPNAALQTDVEEDGFRRSIAEALVDNDVLKVDTLELKGNEEEGGEDYPTELKETKKETESPRSKSASSSKQSRKKSSSRMDQSSVAHLAVDFKFELEEMDYNQSTEESSLDLEESSRSSYEEYEKEMSSANAVKVADQRLNAIGKQLKELEKESRVTQDKAQKEWQKEVSPKLKESIKQLDKQINVLKREQKQALKSNSSFTAMFDEEISELSVEQDALKVQLLFPEEQHFRYGSGGLYIAWDYIWLENLSGSFQLKFASSSYGSQIQFKLQGASASSGVVADITLSGFKVKSEYKSLPSMSLDYVKIGVSLRVDLLLSFFSSQQKWQAAPDQFVVQLLSFKGPFGLTKKMVSALLAVAVRAIKLQILEMLPVELGTFLSELMVPLDLSGSLHVDGGVVVHDLFHGMQKSPRICQMLGYNAEQMLNFLALQKSLHRKNMIKSVVDLLHYRNSHQNQIQWDGISKLWDQAAVIFYQTRKKQSNFMRKSESRMLEISALDDQDADIEFGGTAFLSFSKLLRGAVEVEKNPLSIRFSLDTFKLNVGLYRAFQVAVEYYGRVQRDLEADPNSTESSKLYVEKKRELCRNMQESVTELKKLFDSVQLLFRVHVTSGEDAEVGILAKEIHAQLPISYSTNMEADSYSAFSPIVPAIKHIRTKKNGFVSVKMFHLGSEQLLRKAKFLACKKKHDQLEAFLLEKSHGDDISGEKNWLRLSSAPQGIDEVETIGDSLNNFENDAQVSAVTFAAQKSVLEKFVLRCSADERRIRDLLDVRPADEGIAHLVTVNILRPRISFIVSNYVKLQSGTALFDVQVGASEQDGIEEGDDDDDDDDDDEPMVFGRRDTLMTDEPMVFGLQNTDMTDDHWAAEKQSSLHKMDLEQDEGTPISARGTHGLRLEADIPQVQFKAKLSKIMQFACSHFDDLDIVSDFFDESIEVCEKKHRFIALLTNFIGKYVLLPNFELLLNSEVVLSSSPEDLHVALTTSRQYSPALNFFVKVNVVDC